MSSASAPRRIALLGSTGSIGCNTLDVIAGLGSGFEVVALAAGENTARLAEQVARFRPALVSVRSAAAAADLRRRLEAAGKATGAAAPRIVSGPEGLIEAAAGCGATMVVAATVGVAGLAAIHAALDQGCGLALANKEALVVAGALLMPLARRRGVPILPIDSEHSAIHQCLRCGAPGEAARIILTASGGPFLRWPAEQLGAAALEDALRHPTWNMGRRISLDSATLMNKGFEVIEACHLFGLREDQVEVLVHPQSIVHSMVEFRDGSVIAQLGTADMRTPIQYALTWPQRLPSSRNRLKLEEVAKLEFETPDLQRFPCLDLARAAFRAGQGAPAVLNAADEVATEAFAAGRLGFEGIARVVEATLARLGAPAVDSLDTVLAVDAEARRVAAALLTAV